MAGQVVLQRSDLFTGLILNGSVAEQAAGWFTVSNDILWFHVHVSVCVCVCGMIAFFTFVYEAKCQRVGRLSR